MTRFSQEEISLLDATRLPRHLAIIPDGNRRWAMSANREKTEGHRQGASTITDIVIAAQELGVKAVTVYTFSTENWKRPLWEVSSLIFLMEEKLKAELPRMKEEGIVFHTIGDLTPFPDSLLDTVAHVKEETKHGKGIDFILALNYGGRDELRRALGKIAREMTEGKISPTAVTEELISQYLDTAPFGDPELIIRTSGEMRTSNFLLWQNCYSEFVLVNKFWPDFTTHDLLTALLTYQKRDRREGH